MDARTIIDYAKSLDCVHCGLCLNTCPTYRLTGREPSSPRGRIHLMRSLAEGEIQADADFAHEMDFCLLCRHCESVCPSGVKFGALMEHTRAGLAALEKRPLHVRLARAIGFGVLLRDRGALSLAAALARVFAPARMPLRAERAYQPTLTPAEGERTSAVLMLEGCVMSEIFGGVNRATAAVLARAGCEVRATPQLFCCGSLHAHSGESSGARALAREAIEASEALCDERGAPLPLVSNSAGCGAHLKELAALFEEADPWHARAAALSARTLDFSQLLAREPQRSLLAARMRASSELAELSPIAWDDPCHLCHAQGVRREPRALLALLPGVTRVELAGSEDCCGSAGAWSLTHASESSALLEGKLEALRASGARTLVTSNPGCHMQWDAGVRRAGLDVRVLHLAELLELATRN
ncbi:MAG: 4Fe-4S dicluster domain-containing protein [Planctomycetes bacterium]|nr:4Fe-4S dicluster domain-containing protein [Planctomycetota bacterium]